MRRTFCFIKLKIGVWRLKKVEIAEIRARSVNKSFDSILAMVVILGPFYLRHVRYYQY